MDKRISIAASAISKPTSTSNAPKVERSGLTKNQSSTKSIPSKKHSVACNPSANPSTIVSVGAKNQSTFTSLASGSDTKTIQERKDASRKAKAECDISESTSHTQFYKHVRGKESFQRITTDEYFGLSESMSGSSDTFQCVHDGPEGKSYTEKGLLKRNLVKELDPIPTEPKWTHQCPTAYGWDIVKVLAFIIQDPTNDRQKHRIETHLKDLVQISSNGYKIEYLNNFCVVISYLVETLHRNQQWRDILMILLQHTKKPVIMNSVFDIVTYFEDFTNYLAFLGYLLMRLEDDEMFDVVSGTLIWHLSAPDSQRTGSSTRLCHTLAAAAPVLYETVTRMLAIATSHRFPTFLSIALLLACDSAVNCLELMHRNIIENIFYRFNPYFPDRKLPVYDINPADPQDINLKLGDSSIHMSTTMSLLLILLKTTRDQMNKDPKYALLLPSPDEYAQRCFIWAYRYECRARQHQHQRKILTVIAFVLVHCFGPRLKQFSEVLMPDILTLCVKTEMPPRDDWTAAVTFSKSQSDVQFKKLLIYASVIFIKAFPHNRTMVESRHYLIGLMYLLDPGLAPLRTRWVPSLLAELRKTSLQALVCTVPRLTHNLVDEYGLIRRIMWYIEWYTESPYEISILYWCVRLLHVSIYQRGETRKKTMKSFFDTHGIIIIIRLCYTLLEQKCPPVEMAQTIIALCLRLLTSAVEENTSVSCLVYPSIQWPPAAETLANKMLDVVTYSLDKHYILSDRWLISTLNFVWEAIIWRTEYREKFISRGGIYNLLDIITMTRAPVQCLALALVCDATKAGDAVSQLVTWRATLGAASANPIVVKRGSTIAALLASIFRDECQKTGVQLDANGVITDMESPIMPTAIKEYLAKYEFGLTSPPTPFCIAASDLAGSRMSKAYALLSMLSEDLEHKVTLADEAYNLYKNIQLKVEDETILVLCAHYLTLKLNEVWIETKVKSCGYLPADEDILEEFLHIGRGWAKEIKRQQDGVVQKDKQKEAEGENSLYEFLARVRLNISLDALREVQEAEGENSLYEFLARVRLNISLDALREVRCAARSASRARLTHALLQDAVQALHRRAAAVKTLHAPVIRTYEPPLDDCNMTGQNVKVFSIHPKDKPKPILNYVPSSL